MNNVLSIKNDVITEIFLGKKYEEAEQHDKFMSHLYMNILYPNNYDYWMAHNPPIVKGITLLFDKETQSTYIGTLHHDIIDNRPGFERIEISGEELVQLTIKINHGSGESFENSTFDMLLAAHLPNKMDYKFAHVTFDSGFNLEESEQEVVVNYIY